MERHIHTCSPGCLADRFPVAGPIVLDGFITVVLDGSFYCNRHSIAVDWPAYKRRQENGYMQVLREMERVT